MRTMRTIVVTIREDADIPHTQAEVERLLAGFLADRLPHCETAIVGVLALPVGVAS